MNTDSKSRSTIELIKNKTFEVQPIIRLLSSDKLVKLDLSNSNKKISELQSLDISHLTDYIFSYTKELGGTIGYGGYLEQRVWYQRSELFLKESDNIPEENKRSIHLGVDFWLDVGHSIYLPFNGEVLTCVNNNANLDYGPTIIVKHNVDDFAFHTLYGHLSLESLELVKPGMILEAGAAIGKIGSDKVNGGWPPHLHFQIIINLPDLSGDYPGVAAPANIEFYKENCPDPLIFSGFDI